MEEVARLIKKLLMLDNISPSQFLRVSKWKNLDLNLELLVSK